MSHIQFFVGKVIKKYKDSQRSYRWMKARAFAAHIIWKYNGVAQNNASSWFGVTECFDCMGKKDEFIPRYNEILDLYILCTKEYISLNPPFIKKKKIAI